MATFEDQSAASLEALRSAGIGVARRAGVLDVTFPEWMPPASRVELTGILERFSGVVDAALRAEEEDAVAAAERLLAPGWRDRG